jgi:hypothetical protein
VATGAPAVRHHRVRGERLPRARARRAEEAIALLRAAAAKDAHALEHARDDTDFERTAIRDEPGFAR